MIRFVLNGTAVRVKEDYPADSLLNVLRDELHVYSPKNACLQGECGSCSVMVDGEIICSCLMPICAVGGADVRTLEGFQDDRECRAVQDAMVEVGGVQCGFCTPGVVMTATALLKKHRLLTRNQIREGIAGNLCRCTGYTKIVDAIETAQSRLYRDMHGSWHGDAR